MPDAYKKNTTGGVYFIFINVLYFSLITQNLEENSSKCTGNFFLQLDIIGPFEKKLFFIFFPTDRPVFAAKKSVNQEIKKKWLE